MERFCDDLKEHLARITNYEMKTMDLLTEEEKESWKSTVMSYMWERILYR